MIVLMRRTRDTIRINGNITVTVKRVDNDMITFHIDSPQGTKIRATKGEKRG